MLELIRGARRRFFLNQLLAQGANALSAAVVALIVLLVAGTELLDWRWIVPVFAAAVFAGVYLARRGTPSRYTVAQAVDRRMSLADTLSTAFFFGEAGARSRVPEEIRQFQLAQADRLAATVDARRAVPFRMPRTVYPLAALVLVASSLFALRYGLIRRLDLKPPLALILQQRFEGARRTEEAKAKRPDPPAVEPADEDAAADPGENRNRAEPADAADREAAEGAEQPEARGKAEGDGKQQQAAAEQQSGSEEQEAESQDQAAGGNKNQSTSAEKRNGKGEKSRESASGESPDGSGQESSLLAKVKDAVESLLSRMKPQPQSAGSERQTAKSQNASPDKRQPGSAGQQQQASSKGQKNGGQQGGAGRQQASAEAQASGNPKGSGKSDSQQAGKKPGSGIGSEDGAKDIKQAEQLAAMGKISEIIGKRSANVTGEATVEVQSTSQQLHTPYARRQAEHSEGGAEIGRDEIPVSLQSYVERYFEQVRKQAGPGR